MQSPTRTAPASTAPVDAAAPPSTTVDDDAGTPDASQPTTPPPTTPPPPPTTAAVGCSRDRLRQRADAYLQALADGDPTALNPSPDVRYTENGQLQMLGLGIWLNRPQSMFSRHFLDEASCSTITVAVVSQALQRTILGVRLRYVGDRLSEIEAQVVVPNFAYYDPDSVIMMGADPWTVPVNPSVRMTREALTTLAKKYFDSATDASQLPPHSPDCKRTQNGKLFDPDGNCGKPGGQRFEQQRFPVVDDTAGIVAAVVIYQAHLGMYLIKAQNNTIQDIDIIGGAATPTSGW